MPKTGVVDIIDVETFTKLPVHLHQQCLDEKICQMLKLKTPPSNLTKWKKMLHNLANPKGKVVIGIVAKYLQHQDAYKSVFEALKHGALANQLDLELRLFDAEKITDSSFFKKENCDGYLVPGGFGERGWEGKIHIAKHCREQHIPYFGICLGMQVLCTEFVRNVVGLSEANSTEINPDTKNPVVSLLSEQKEITNLGGTMRLGAFACHLRASTKAAKAYGVRNISERHRHRYEFNNAYKEICEEKGLIFSGVFGEGNLCEIAEIKHHPWMIGVQFHPEFKSKPTDPHPLFKEFIKSAFSYRNKE